jgi:hypothetical protein
MSFEIIKPAAWLFIFCIHFAPIIRGIKNAPASCFRVSHSRKWSAGKKAMAERVQTNESLHQNAINISAARLIIKNLQPHALTVCHFYIWPATALKNKLLDQFFSLRCDSARR